MCKLLHDLLQHAQWQHALRHGAIKFVTDSQCAAADVMSMGGAASVFPHVQHLYELAAAHDIDIIIEWRPREHALLQFADMHSKMLDVSDWSIGAAAFQQICGMFRVQATVDWFASTSNALCPVFYSRYLVDGCAGVDAFDHCWRLSPPALSYLCPPHMIVVRVLAKIRAEHADCILVLPAWYKVWHGLLLQLPIRDTLEVPGTCITWGPRAPASHDWCAALSATGLKAYYIRW